MEQVSELKQCPYCAEKILAAAIKCRYCGSQMYDPIIGPPMIDAVAVKPPTVRWPFKLAAAVTIGFIVFGILKAPALVASSPRSLMASDTTVEPISESQEHRKKRAIYKTTAQELYRDYAANEVATDQRINGAVVQVSGVIKSIDKDFMDHPTVRLDANNDEDSFDTVEITLLKSDTDAAGRFFKGEHIVVICEKMRRIVDSPMGDDCRVVTGTAREPVNHRKIHPSSQSLVHGTDASSSDRVIRVIAPNAGHLVTGETIPANYILEILFIQEPCDLPIEGASTMHRAWLHQSVDAVGCWYPTMDDNFVTIDGGGRLSASGTWLEAQPLALLHANGSATITEPEYDSATAYQKASHRMIEQFQARRNQQP